MIVNVYVKKKDGLSPDFYENYEEGLYATIHNVDMIKDIGTDYDLLRNGDQIPIKRYSKDVFHLIIEE